MSSEFDCPVCCKIFNSGHRCPRELTCGHSFCEECLLTLCKSDVSLSAITCPVCRVATPVSGDVMKLHAELRKNVSVLGQMEAKGLLGQQEEEEEEEEKEKKGKVIEASAYAAAAGPPVKTKGVLRRVWKALCKAFAPAQAAEAAPSTPPAVRRRRRAENDRDIALALANAPFFYGFQ